jgi:prophage regulatory protein
MSTIEETSGTPNEKPLRLETGEAAWARAGISRAYAYDLMARGEFPRPVKVGRAIRFVSTEVDEWIAQRIAERDAT